MYYINTLKRDLVDTNAYKLQPFFSERVVVDGHGCYTALHFGVKAKELHYLIIKLNINLLVLLKEPSIMKALLTLHVTTETHFWCQSYGTTLPHN